MSLLAYTGFWWETLRERELGGTRHRWEGKIKMDLQEMGCGVWNGSRWFRIGPGRGHL